MNEYLFSMHTFEFSKNTYNKKKSGLCYSNIGHEPKCRLIADTQKNAQIMCAGKMLLIINYSQVSGNSVTQIFSKIMSKW